MPDICQHPSTKFEAEDSQNADVPRAASASYTNLVRHRCYASPASLSLAANIDFNFKKQARHFTLVEISLRHSAPSLHLRLGLLPNHFRA